MTDNHDNHDNQHSSDHSTRDIDVGLGVTAHIHITHFPDSDTRYVFSVTFVTPDGEQWSVTGYHST